MLALIFVAFQLLSASHAPGVSDEIRVRARNLHEQAISQTTRIQRIGRETQRISTTLARAAAAQGPGGAFDGNSLDLTYLLSVNV